jgi:MFS family permease
MTVPRSSIARRDTSLLVAARMVRLFAYGFLSVVLALYLTAIGFSAQAVGALLTMTLMGDAGISLWLTLRADQTGRRRTLMIGSLLMIGAGLVFAMTHDWLLLVVAAVIGVISPSGNEIGPFLSIEQAALTEVLPSHQRTNVFAWYQLAGAFATAVGSLCGGLLASGLEQRGFAPVDAYRVILYLYAGSGTVLWLLFLRLSPAIEVAIDSTPVTVKRKFGLHRSQKVVARLSALFALDAFAGGFVVQSLLAYWFHVRFGADERLLGEIFFGANLLAGVSALAASRLAARIGLLNTMVATHLPSNVLLCLVPLMPSLPLAITVLLVRFSISQMDVPTRQSYTMAVVAPDERSAAAGITGIARSIGASVAPALSGLLLPVAPAALFLISGGLKIVYDLLLYRSFTKLSPPET